MNGAASKNFDLGPTAVFDEGGIATHSCVYCARQYNKDNPDKFRNDLFVLSNSIYYFIRHLDGY